ncbi:hypothetical protein E3E12_07860 [Formicincola oecophyllae]|uniref:Uncharacterized protein n=1 Tax=Formicincola oecophyllae TaxID=2558361 RepID=A0A4Y6UCI9_9PROT|nr:hypothetical protein [Formicincola oecophyllae]QDH14111.1 hypothetical protein E3E12_07860 [Formicincola oecophyllae]
MTTYYYGGRTYVNIVDNHNRMTLDLNLTRNGRVVGSFALNHEDALETVDVTCMGLPQEDGPYPLSMLMRALERGEEVLWTDIFYDIRDEDDEEGEEEDEDYESES